MHVWIIIFYKHMYSNRNVNIDQVFQIYNTNVYNNIIYMK